MAEVKTKTLDDSTKASHPGGVPLSFRRLRDQRPDLVGFRALWDRLMVKVGRRFDRLTYIDEQLRYGDARAAVVVSLHPLLVAAYTDELDCVAMLEFPEDFVGRYGLRIGSRLLTVNCYGKGRHIQADLTIGPKCTGRWVRFHPLIADFLTEDSATLDSKKAEITEEEWRRADRFGQAYLRERPGIFRDGRPISAGRSAIARHARRSK